MPKAKIVHAAQSLCFTLFLAIFGNAYLRAADSSDGIEFFEKRIRPVLVERCYECHSAQSEKVKGGLLLDTNAGLLKGGDGGPVLVPGNAEKSRLIEAIRYGNKDLQMPPKKKLSDQQIADFVAWINLGAPDPRSENRLALTEKSPRPERTDPPPRRDHWAFQAPKEHAIPQVKNTAWPKTPIDFFILAALEQKGLVPAPSADKSTLIRRATFDLTGLPPTPEDVRAFLDDDSSEAFARVVDRLLASPRYGERWGRYWLDVARYADTKGYVYSDREEGRFVHSYAYRDWVVRALNEDMPYDRFLLLQIAADQVLDSKTPISATTSDTQLSVSSSARDDLAAMGFLTLGRRFLGVVHDIIDDRIDVVMRGTQALTVGCARCHDHKYDPIPTKDYYSLYGVFDNCTERMLALREPPNNDIRSADYEKGLRERVAKYDQAVEKKRVEFSNRFRAKVGDYLIAVLDVKKLPTEEHYEIRGPDDLNPTIARNWENYLLQMKQSPDAVFRPWISFASLDPDKFEIEAKKSLERWASASAPEERVNPVILRLLTEPSPSSMRDVAERYGRTLLKIHQQWQGLLQQASTNKTELPKRLSDPDQEEIRQVLYGPNAPVNIPKLAAADLEWYFDEGSRVELMKLHAEIERWIIKSPGAPPHAVVLEDKPAPKNPRVLLRGNPANKGDEVPRQFLQVLAGEKRQPFQKGSGRLELAKAIASPENPLTARVMVNRIWLHHFGSGLVRTPSDFGIRCEPPSHPELLDWLARYFIAHGWSMKAMHRAMMLSSVYQQSSETSPSQIDPQNRLLSHMNRQRLDFEALRDSLMVVTGEMDGRIGGKPIELFKASSPPRRTLYGYVDRQFLPGMLRVFDFANPDMHNPQRSETTVPQQALFFMNSPLVVERARALIQRVETEGLSSVEDRIQRVHQLAYQRPATSKQIALGRQFLAAVQAEPAYTPPPPPAPVWFYGYGSYDEVLEEVTSFAALPHFTDEAWQGGEKWPDAKLGWVRLTAEGGHAGNDLQHAAIRRWISPLNASITINGAVKHDHDAGDGIRARILSSRHGLLGEWTLHKQRAETKVESVAIQKGDVIDFVVDFNANLNSDDFTWAPVIRLANRSKSAEPTDESIEWNAKKDFSGPPVNPPKPLNAWEQYAQVLLLSNEFVFVD